MEYPETFKNLLKSVPDNTYIGTGNPNAKILFIANEPAIDTATEEGKIQYKREISGNLNGWIRNINEGKDFSSIPDSVFQHELCNPLFPYKGQYFKRETTKHNGGVHQMWYNQQKLINMILRQPKMEFIDFHKYCFSTDFSIATAKRSCEVNPEERSKSIIERVGLFHHQFFLDFPIIIVACGHYVKKNPALKDLTEVFRTSDRKLFRFDETQSKLETPWLNIHRALTDGQPARILLHTQHLVSHNVDEAYMKRIAEICRESVPEL